MKLSETQSDFIARLAEHGRIIRYPGGFWSAPGMSLGRNGAPEWYFQTGTVQGLLSRNLIEVSRTMRSGDNPPFAIEVVFKR